jgi:lipoprotein signal peptidase
MLLSLSLLINALADNGYTRDYINGNASSWPWDLFYISDFIIMIGALFWYNKFYISDLINAKRVSNRE